MRSRDKGISVSDRGRVVIDDIPDDERRRSSSKKKSDVKKKLKEKSDEAEESLRKKSKVKKSYEKDDEPKKKKKRKKKTAGELIADGKIEKVRKKLAKFESKALAVISEIQGGDNVDYLPSITSAGESEFLAEYGRIYNNLQTIIRKLEKNMLDPEKEYVSSKDVYAVSTLYSQMRETIADMRSIKDMQAQADSLAQHILEPLKSTSGEALIGLYYKIIQACNHHIQDTRVLESLTIKIKTATSETANTMNNDFTAASSKIIDVLNGTR